MLFESIFSDAYEDYKHLKELNEHLIQEFELTEEEISAIEEKVKKENLNLFEDLQEVL